MTVRRLMGHGLTAGLTWTEMQTMKPGTIFDMFVIVHKYREKTRII